MRPTRRLVVRVVVGVVCAGFAATVVAGEREQLQEAADQLTHVSAGWAVLSGLAEVASYLAAGLSLCLLAGRRLRALGAGAALAGQAAGNCLPGGGAVTAAVIYRELRREGVGPPRAVRASVVTSVVQAVTLPLLALVVVRMTPAESRIPGLAATSAIALVAVAVLAAAGLVLHRTGRLAPTLAALGRSGGRLLSRVRPRGRDAEPPAADAGQAGDLGAQEPVPVTGRVAAALTSLGMGYWALDALCLVAAFPAIGAPIPWAGLIVGYVAAQVAAVLPFVPGGLGVVEGSLTLALVEFGGGQQQSLAAVLLYRIISFWLVILVGGLLVALPVRSRGAGVAGGPSGPGAPAGPLEEAR